MCIRLIKERTWKGLDKNNKAFKKLSPAYIKQRRKIRLDPNTSPTKSNVTRTGAMVRSLKFKLTGNSFSIGVPSSQAKKVTYNSRKGRSFLGLTKDEVQQIKVYIDKLIKRYL
jgi:hypothetical protein